MVSIRAGISRHLQMPPYKRNFVILSSPKFAASNKMFTAVIKNNKKQGLDHTSHHPTINENDMAKLLDKSSFDLNDPVQLQENVFFDIMLHFARRGGEGLRDLKKDSFIIKNDGDDYEYICKNFTEITKNHQDLQNKENDEGRIYATNTDTCPVKSFRLYKEKLDKEADIFFTKPRSGKGFKKDDLTWFTKRPLGLNTLLSKMKSISLRLKLSKIYTNHCCRATAVTLLSSNGIEARKIMEVTGHKSESSLRSYDRNTSDSTKRKISNILSNTSLPKASVVNQTLQVL